MIWSFFWHDLRQTVRLLSRKPVFALGAIVVLALGIGPVTSLASLMNATIFRPWQVRDPDSMAVIRAQQAGQEVHGAISIAEYRYLRQNSHTISHMAASIPAASRISDGAGNQFRVESAFVNADYFKALGVEMAAGRDFVVDDEDYSVPKAVAIISDRLWRGRFRGDPALVGGSLRIGKGTFHVVGVVKRGFSGVERGEIGNDLWMPLPARAIGGSSPPDLARFADPRGDTLQLLAGRLSSGATRASAAAELSLLSGEFRAAASLPSNGVEVIDTRPMSFAPPGTLRSLMPVHVPLLLAVLLVLFVACGNVGNLLLAQAVSRRRDIAIRLSLGASRARIVRQLLMEAAVLSAAASVVGLALAFVVPDVMVGFGFGFGWSGFERITLQADAVRSSFYAPDARVFLLAMVFACLTTVLAGLAPTLRATRAGLAAMSAEGHGRTAASARLRLVLLASQIALTTLLLVGAGLLTRAIRHATSLNPGFTIAGIETVSVEPRMPAGSPMARRSAFFLRLRDALQGTALGSVAFSEWPPFSNVNYVMMAHRPDESPGVFHRILARPVSRDYFTVLGIPIVEGRVPESDTDSHELILSEAAARELWPHANPIGKTLLAAISRTEFETCEIVGIAKDVPVRSMSEIEPVIYRAPSWTAATLIVRSTSPGFVDRVRAIAVDLERDVTVTGRPLADYVRESMTTAVLTSRGAWAIGALGLVLAVVGAFGAFGYAVEERRYEIGLRMALGARASQIAALVFLGAGQAFIWGLAAGFALSLAAAPLLRHFLYGLNPFDPVAYAQVAGILAVAAGLATWIPARRAVNIDPARTLRHD